jgi:PKD repeat protein
VDFEDAFYDFDNMAATYATAASQLLLFHAGVSVNMDYDWSGSGAYVVGGYPSAFYAMENFFGYHSDISYEWKDNHSTNEYRDIIKNELDNSRPVISQGYGSGYGGGHAWNIDGYSGNNLHCNWGWGGSSNGYYNLTSMGGFPDDQAVIIDILPNMDDPLALFEYEVDDLTVLFIDLSEIVNEVELDSWLWNFGDGNTSSNSAPVHTYSQGGSYVVSLTVTNIYGLESEPHAETVQLGSSMPGDINSDSMLNVLDIVLVVNFILGSDTPSASEFSAADLNSDGILNILDIVTLTNLILGA